MHTYVTHQKGAALYQFTFFVANQAPLRKHEGHPFLERPFYRDTDKLTGYTRLLEKAKEAQARFLRRNFSLFVIG